LARDCRRRAYEAGAKIQQHLDSSLFKEAWMVARGWYQQASGHPPKPSRQDLEKVEKEYKSLYTAEEYIGIGDMASVIPKADILDDAPEVGEIIVAVS